MLFTSATALVPVDLALGLQNDVDTKGEYTAISGAYHLGVAKLTGGVNRLDKPGAPDATEYTIGVSVPVGAMTLSAAYASSETAAGGVETREGSGFGFVATYALSKRTRAYVGYRDVESTLAGSAKQESSRYAVGVRHDF